METGIFIFTVAIVAIYSLGTIFWIWMIVDCAIKEPAKKIDKQFWILCIVMTHMVGALVYLLVRRPKRIEQFGR